MVVIYSEQDDDDEADAAADYSKTPGIDVGKQSVKGVGNFVFWDCAGQSEYSVTHGMFLGSRQSLFVVVYDLEKLSKGITPSTKYWLPFIKATRGQHDIPHVILVGSHLDKITDQRKAQRVAEELLHQSQKLFADTLQINDELIILDARKVKSRGMELLKNVLKRQREEIIGNERLPKLCDKMQKIVKPWREEEVPVISWGQYFERVKEKYPGIDVETLRSVTKYLHMMGEVYLAEFADKEDQVVLNTQWFTSEIIGAAFAGKEFATQFQTLPNQPYYTLQQLRDFFTKKMDTTQLLALLIHMDLVHETNDHKYLLPGKLPDDGPEIAWYTRRVYDVKGRSIECVEETDMFNPNVFPCVQKKILDECKATGSTTDVSRSAVKFSMGSIEVLVQLTKLKRSINIAVMSPDKESMKACYNSFQHVLGLIQLELAIRSPGTNLRETYISPDSLREGKDLENVVTYTKEFLLEQEEKGQCVGHKGKPEEITKILFQGYDKIFLQEFGLECRYEWLPIKTVEGCFGRLDIINDSEKNYRAVGKVLGIQKHVVDKIAEDSRRREESATDNILKRWCRDNNRKMTIVMLYRLFRRIVDNDDALKAIQEVVDTYGYKHRHGEVEESAIEIGAVGVLHTPQLQPSTGLSEEGTVPSLTLSTSQIDFSCTPPVPDQEETGALLTETSQPGSFPPARAPAGMDQISDGDISDISELSRTNLQHLYVKLGLKHNEIENAEASENTTDVRLKAASVLRYWRQKMASQATRKQIIIGLEQCCLNADKEALQEKWRP